MFILCDSAVLPSMRRRLHSFDNCSRGVGGSRPPWGLLHGRTHTDPLGCTFLTRLIYSSGYKGSNPWLMFHFQHHLSYLSCKLSWIVLCIATDGDSPERRCHGSGNGSVLMISTTHPAMQRGIHLLRCRSYSHLLLYEFVRFWTCQLAYATHVGNWLPEYMNTALAGVGS